MSPDRLFLVPLVLGHVALFVLAANVMHALGHDERVMARAKLVVLAGFGSVSLVIAWEAWHGSILAWSWPSLVYGWLCVLTGVVFLPAATAYLHHRNRPGNIDERESVVDLAASAGRDALIGAGKYGWLLRVPGNQSLRLRKLECEVGLPDLPRALDGLSVLHVSDLHLSPSYDLRFFEAVFREASERPADLVLFTGDLVDHDDAVDWVVPLFSTLRGRLGSFAILGNHDLQHRPDRLRRATVEAGYVDLEGRWATVEAGGLTVALGGTSYPWGPPLPLAGKPAADYRILLSHAPDQFYWAERAGFDLMLSGHNHGGQVRLPLVGPVFMPSVYSRRFDRGFFRRRGLTLHVSQGVAGKHPIRYGCPPEVTRLVLRHRPAERLDAPHNTAAHSHGPGPSSEASRADRAPHGIGPPQT